MAGKLDLSALEGMNIPEIPLDPKNEVKITPEDKEDLKEEIIKEVESLEEFTKEDPKDEGSKEGKKEDSEIQEEEIPADNGDQSQEGEVSIIKGIAEYLKSENIFDYKDEDFEDSTDFLSKKINEVAEAKAEEKLKELPEVIYELAKNYKEGVPLSDLIISKSKEIEYSNIDEKTLEKDVELQKKLVADWLVAQDYDDDEITKKLTKYEDALILEDEAVTALKKLRIYEQRYQESLKESASKQRAKDLQDYQDKVKSIEKEIEDSQEIIPGITLSKEEKKKLFDAYTKVDSKGETALIKKLKADPKSWYKVTQFLVLMDGNLETVKSKLKTEVSKKAKETVSTYKETPGLNKLNINTIKKAMERIKKQ